MKTAQEILDYVKTVDDFLGFQSDVLLEFLPFEQVKPFLKDGVTEADWKYTEPTRENVIAVMRDYMDFAWGKATGHRSISASRSVEHYKAWLWLLDDNESLEFAEDHYAMYGAPVLKHVCDKYGFDMPQNESAQNMANGLPCDPQCEEGCR